MTAVPAPDMADDVALAVCRVEDSVAVHLTLGDTAPGRDAAALCGGAAAPGRPPHLLLRSACVECVAEAQALGGRSVRDGASVWINLGRLAQTLRAGVRIAA